MKIKEKAGILTKKLLIILTALTLTVPLSAEVYASEVTENRELLVGGMPFGVKFYSDGVIVVGFSEVKTNNGTKNPAYDAGLRINDIIKNVNGIDVKTTEELTELIENSTDEVKITYVRAGEERNVTLIPEIDDTDGKLKTGMWIRDTTAGIGTITYIDPKSGEFAGLGHGICDPETGELLKMERGVVVDVEISGITKGKSGTPGELKGFFTTEKSGVLTYNTDSGVYGMLNEIPFSKIPLEEIEVGKRDEAELGEAEIWCTLDSGNPQKYTISIDEIRLSSEDNHSFSITVTDDELIAKTGGIVQGMSGSPIIQNGKLIGAVTHVLVGDPREGYGIFIENMLDAAG